MKVLWASIPLLCLITLFSLACVCPAKSNQQLEERKSNIELLKNLSQNQGSEQFWTYYGFRDWWRIPLIYPYQITMIDHFQHGDICVSESENIAEAKFRTVVQKVERFSFLQNYIFGKTQQQYFTLRIDSEKVSYFDSEAEMLKSMNLEPLKLKSVQQWADAFAL